MPTKYINGQCANCNSKIGICYSDLFRFQNHFCSRSCRTIFYNKKRAEDGYSTKNKTKELICITCGEKSQGNIHCSNKTFRCESCVNNKIKPIKKSKKRRSGKKSLICKTCNSLILNHPKAKYCDNCRPTPQQNGLASASKRKDVKRSKNEIYLSELCIKHFSNVSCNDPIFNGWDCDILVHDYLLAIHWNGPWHYKECGGKHSLSQVQSRDKIKHDQIEKAGWVNYIIRDDGRFNKKFVESEFQKLLEYIDKNYKPV